MSRRGDGRRAVSPLLLVIRESTNMKQVLLLLAVALVASWSFGQTNPPSAAWSGEPRSAEQELLALEQAWAGAVQQRDTAKIDQIQAGEYMFTDPAGQLWTKSRELDTLKSGALAITSFVLSEQQVRLYENTAVVAQRITWTGAFNGSDISGPQRMTDVFVKRDGRWQCVTSQATRISSP